MEADIFNRMPLCAVVREEVFVAHASIPPPISKELRGLRHEFVPHGSPNSRIVTLAELREVRGKTPQERIFSETQLIQMMLSTDPNEQGTGIVRSADVSSESKKAIHDVFNNQGLYEPDGSPGPRNHKFSYQSADLTKFLSANKLKLMIRGHQPVREEYSAKEDSVHFRVGFLGNKDANPTGQMLFCLSAPNYWRTIHQMRGSKVQMGKDWGAFVSLRKGGSQRSLVWDASDKKGLSKTAVRRAQAYLDVLRTYNKDLSLSVTVNVVDSPSGEENADLLGDVSHTDVGGEHDMAWIKKEGYSIGQEIYPVATATKARGYTKPPPIPGMGQRGGKKPDSTEVKRLLQQRTPMHEREATFRQPQ